MSSKPEKTAASKSAARSSLTIAPQFVPTIVFEDTHLIVVDKPAGLLSQGEHTGDANLVDWLRQYLGRPYVGLVHRLDRNTSGLLIVGKRTKAAQRLTDSLQQGRLTRTYLAWIEGTLEQEQRWRHFLVKDERQNITRVVQSPPGRGAGGNGSAGNGFAKEAALTIRPLARGEWQGQPLTLAELTLETGRSHQIRAQASHEGYPLLGDAKYGARSRGFGRPALHSHRLRVDHPMSKEWLEYEAPLPRDMASIPARDR